MHIPDGMLSTQVAVIADVGAVGFIAYAVAWVKQHLNERKIVLMAVLGALIFALQMLNFPVAGGTSGHFLGAALAALILGFWPAVIVMAAVLGIQALVFSDGGILAYGANLFNMGIVAAAVGWGVSRLITFFGTRARSRESRFSHIAGAAVGGWFGTMAAATACSLEIIISGHAKAALILPAMLSVHALIGIGEGVITGALVGYLVAVRPDLLDKGLTEGRQRSWRSVYVVLGIVALIGAGLSWLASSSPDGLERVYFADKLGAHFPEMSLLGKGTLFADYGIRGLGTGPLGTILAGVVGLGIVAVLLWLLFVPKKRKTTLSEDVLSGAAPERVPETAAQAAPNMPAPEAPSLKRRL